MHAAGVIIADKPLNNYLPVFKTGDDQITTGYSMGTLEKIGLLKVDFLGLRTLTVIDETLKLIKKIRTKCPDKCPDPVATFRFNLQLNRAKCTMVHWNRGVYWPVNTGVWVYFGSHQNRGRERNKT